MTAAGTAQPVQTEAELRQSLIGRLGLTGDDLADSEVIYALNEAASKPMPRTDSRLFAYEFRREYLRLVRDRQRQLRAIRPSDEALSADEIAALRQLYSQTTQGRYVLCHNGACSCATVASHDLDVPVHVPASSDEGDVPPVVNQQADARFFAQMHNLFPRIAAMLLVPPGGDSAAGVVKEINALLKDEVIRWSDADEAPAGKSTVDGVRAVLEELGELRKARLADTNLIFSVHHALSDKGALTPGQTIAEAIIKLKQDHDSYKSGYDEMARRWENADSQFLQVREVLSAAGIDHIGKSIAEAVTELAAKAQAQPTAKPKAKRKPSARKSKTEATAKAS